MDRNNAVVSPFFMMLKKEYYLTWLVAMALSTGGKREVDAEDVLGLLYAVNRVVKDNSGINLLNFKFVKLSGKLYSKEFYDVLTDLASWGIIRQRVEARSPQAIRNANSGTTSTRGRHNVVVIKRMIKPVPVHLPVPLEVRKQDWLLEASGLDLWNVIAELAKGRFRDVVKSALRDAKEGDTL